MLPQRLQEPLRELDRLLESAKRNLSLDRWFNQYSNWFKAFEPKVPADAQPLFKPTPFSFESTQPDLLPQLILFYMKRGQALKCLEKSNFVANLAVKIRQHLLPRIDLCACMDFPRRKNSYYTRITCGNEFFINGQKILLSENAYLKGKITDVDPGDFVHLQGRATWRTGEKYTTTTSAQIKIKTNNVKLVERYRVFPYQSIDGNFTIDASLQTVKWVPEPIRKSVAAMIRLALSGTMHYSCGRSHPLLEESHLQWAKGKTSYL